MIGPFIAVFAQRDGKIIASIEELPATYAKGATIEDARAALIVELALSSRRTGTRCTSVVQARAWFIDRCSPPGDGRD